MSVDPSIQHFREHPDQYTLRVKKEKDGKEVVKEEKKGLWTFLKSHLFDRSSYKLHNVICALGGGISNKNSNIKYKLISTINAIAQNQRAGVLAQAAPLLSGITNGMERVELIDCIAKLSTEDRSEVLSLAAPLLNRVTGGKIKIEILTFLANHKLSPEQIRKISTLLNGIRDEEIKTLFISTFSRVSPDEIDQFTEQVILLQDGLSDESEIAAIIQALAYVDSPEKLNLLMPALKDKNGIERAIAISNMASDPELIYRVFIDRTQLKNAPLQALKNLNAQFQFLDNRAYRLNVRFLNEKGIDTGGLSRQFVADLFAGIREKMQFKECENGLYRPILLFENGRFQPLNETSTEIYHQVGQLMMFCLNATQAYPIGMLFDQGLFNVLTELKPGFEQLNFDNLQHFEVLFGLYKSMNNLNETDRNDLSRLEKYLQPLTDSTTENTLMEAYAFVEFEDPIERLQINYDVDKIKENFPAIQAELKHYILKTMFQPYLEPIIEIAKGMQQAPFNLKLPWNEVHQLSPAKLSEKLQGTVTRKMILEKLEFRDTPKEKQVWITNWIKTVDDKKIQKFLFALTGSPALGDKNLVIQNSSGAAIAFHTCFNRVHIPMKGIETEQIFIELLEATIEGSDFSEA